MRFGGGIRLRKGQVLVGILGDNPKVAERARTSKPPHPADATSLQTAHPTTISAQGPSSWEEMIVELDREFRWGEARRHGRSGSPGAKDGGPEPVHAALGASANGSEPDRHAQ